MNQTLKGAPPHSCPAAEGLPRAKGFLGIEGPPPAWALRRLFASRFRDEESNDSCLRLTPTKREKERQTLS